MHRVSLREINVLSSPLVKEIRENMIKSARKKVVLCNREMQQAAHRMLFKIRV